MNQCDWESGNPNPEHVHPNRGDYTDVHIESALLSAVIPYSYAISRSQNVAPRDVIAGAAWDIASTIDPFFITDALEWLFDMDPSVYDDCSDK